MLNKILVAIDITDIDNSTFKTALSLAKMTGAKLMLLNIVAPDNNNDANPFVYSGYEYDLTDDSLISIYQKRWQKFKQERKERLSFLAEEAAIAGVETEYIQDFGNPGRTICNRAKSWSADLILIGSRGLTGVGEILLGSVSNYVTHHAPCSVLVAREKYDSGSEI